MSIVSDKYKRIIVYKIVAWNWDGSYKRLLLIFLKVSILNISILMFKGVGKFFLVNMHLKYLFGTILASVIVYTVKCKNSLGIK